MKSVRFRFAKFCDSSSIARLHVSCSLQQDGGFMHKLGEKFLKRYYEVTISNKSSIVLIAVDENDEILGFHSGTLDASEHFASLRKNKFRFVLPIFIAICRKPKLAKEIYTRYRFTSEESKLNFGIKYGARGEYWGWNPLKPNAVESLNLHRNWHMVVKQMGVQKVRSEVDIINQRIYKSIKIMGGIFLEEITLEDGRRRGLVEYDLTKF